MKLFALVEDFSQYNPIEKDNNPHYQKLLNDKNKISHLNALIVILILFGVSNIELIENAFKELIIIRMNIISKAKFHLSFIKFILFLNKDILNSNSKNIMLIGSNDVKHNIPK